MECLPGLGAHENRFSETMRFAWLLTQESFELQKPSRPPRGSAAEVERWSTSSLQQWLEQKNRLVEAARAELNTAAEESPPQRVLAGALVGLMYEDVARTLLTVPTPQDIQREEQEIVEAYRYVVEAEAGPFLVHARRAYHACAANGANVGMRDWAAFCSRRREQLPQSHSEAVAASAPGTSVEVVAQ